MPSLSSACYSKDMTNTAAAHIITADADTLGEPEIIIMTRDEGMGAQVIETHPVAVHLGDARAVLSAHEWRMTGDPVEVQAGYFVVAVERI